MTNLYVRKYEPLQCVFLLNNAEAALYENCLLLHKAHIMWYL